MISGSGGDGSCLAVEFELPINVCWVGRMGGGIRGFAFGAGKNVVSADVDEEDAACGG